MADTAALAHQLLELHHRGTTLVLPTVWDAWSARAVVDAGFEALTIGSHPLADSRGQSDNEGMTLDDALDGIRHITSAVDVPVSADIESGYATPAAELVERVLGAGAVGINVEDTVHSEGGRMRSLEEHADYIGAIRAAADDAGVELVINARTDVFIKPAGTFEDPLAEAIERMRACEAAGARCLYPVLADADAVRAMLSELNTPINVVADPVNGSSVGSLEEVREMGVHRISFGPTLQRQLVSPLTELVTPWR